MILSIYITLGIFLLLAVRDVSANRSLIAFTGWSSLAHASVMILQSFQISTSAPSCRRSASSALSPSSCSC
jgi:hypothetical protein